MGNRLSSSPPQKHYCEIKNLGFIRGRSGCDEASSEEQGKTQAAKQITLISPK